MSRLNELTYNDVYEWLQNKGWQELGAGYYGSAWVNPKHPDKVLKLGPAYDGWPAYVAWANEAGYGGTFAPKLYALHVHKNYYAAVVERFTHSAEDEMDEGRWDEDDFGDLLKAASKLTGSNRYGRINMTVPEAREIVDRHRPGLAAFLKEASTAFKSKGYGAVIADLHAGNWMFRSNGELVLTDPISDEITASEAPKRYSSPEYRQRQLPLALVA